MCEAAGRTRLAEELDHIIPLASGGEDKEDNRQGLCKPCHEEKTASEGSLDKRAIPYPEWLKPAACQLVIVFGPPGSGKSHYVTQQADPSDLVIDLDLIRAGLAGTSIYESESVPLGAALWQRNRILGALAHADPDDHAWFIVSGAGKQVRDWWTSKLKPIRTHVCREPFAVCASRIHQDTRRPPHIREQHVEAAAHWWRAERRTPQPTRQGYGADGEPLQGG